MCHSGCGHVCDVIVRRKGFLCHRRREACWQNRFLGLESIAVRIDTLTFLTDSLYDIRLFGVSEDRFYGMTADNIIVVLDEDGHVVSARRRSGRGPANLLIWALPCTILTPMRF